MSSRLLSLVVSLLLLSCVMASAPAFAAPDPQPRVVLAALDQAPGELPAGDAAGHDQAETLLDVPDQLEGPRALHEAPPRAHRMEPQLSASLTQPHLKGPQRPPRASGRSA